ncbi:hypothetical protein PR048_000424 [Dryococelus australis]|uniref:Uncharacterized protein n=1 Tax=Dryococelus australis TaxID=614101 RepID=A0ABQ9IEK0_9NEOP|nr:hypothetical protein PR048_000424 [Dryococelus australis]
MYAAAKNLHFCSKLGFTQHEEIVVIAGLTLARHACEVYNCTGVLVNGLQAGNLQELAGKKKLRGREYSICKDSQCVWLRWFSGWTGGAATGFSHAGMVPDNVTCRRVFSGESRFPPPLHSGATPYSTLLTLIGSQDLDVKSHLNLFTHSILNFTSHQTRFANGKIARQLNALRLRAMIQELSEQEFGGLEHAEYLHTGGTEKEKGRARGRVREQESERKRKRERELSDTLLQQSRCPGSSFRNCRCRLLAPPCGKTNREFQNFSISSDLPDVTQTGAAPECNGAEETGYLRDNPSTSGIVRHDSQIAEMWSEHCNRSCTTALNNRNHLPGMRRDYVQSEINLSVVDVGQTLEILKDIQAALNIDVLRADESEERRVRSNAGMKGRGKRELAEKTCQPAFPHAQNPGGGGGEEPPPVIEPDSLWYFAYGKAAREMNAMRLRTIRQVLSEQELDLQITCFEDSSMLNTRRQRKRERESEREKERVLSDLTYSRTSRSVQVVSVTPVASRWRHRTAKRTKDLITSAVCEAPRVRADLCYGYDNPPWSHGRHDCFFKFAPALRRVTCSREDGAEGGGGGVLGVEETSEIKRLVLTDAREIQVYVARYARFKRSCRLVVLRTRCFAECDIIVAHSYYYAVFRTVLEDEILSLETRTISCNRIMLVSTDLDVVKGYQTSQGPSVYAIRNSNYDTQSVWRGQMDRRCGMRIRIHRRNGEQLASHQSELDSIPGGVALGFSHVRIVPDDAVGQRVFSGESRFPRPFIPALLRTRLSSLSSALKTSMLKVARISSFTQSLTTHNNPNDIFNANVCLFVTQSRRNGSTDFDEIWYKDRLYSGLAHTVGKTARQLNALRLRGMRQVLSEQESYSNLTRCEASNMRDRNRPYVCLE